MKEPKKTPTKHICAVKPQPPPVCDYLKELVADGVLEIEGEYKNMKYSYHMSMRSLPSIRRMSMFRARQLSF